MIHSKKIDFNRIVVGDLFDFQVNGSMVIIEDTAWGEDRDGNRGVTECSVEDLKLRSVMLVPHPDDPVQSPLPLKWDNFSRSEQKRIIKDVLGQLDIQAAY